MIENKILEDYINSFYGYGIWSANYWFVGIEENGGYTIEDTITRINSWNGYRTDLIDCKEHHSNIGHHQFFTKGKHQPTWWGLMKLRKAIEGKDITTASLRDMQRNNWGQKNSENLILDLFPLPSPSVKDWKYDKWSKLTYLTTRSDYFKELAERRINYLQEKIQLNEPKVVFFYGSSMMKYWNKVVPNSFQKEGKTTKVGRYYLRVLESDRTVFVQIPHPSAIWGNEWYENAGKVIQRSL
ncbi:hypothetical protein [Autumnicola psychrophila]|uniref:Uracil-DNA glycosylase-like domain-containing protein n=1 Tax=Autumnicola psychrophila TaxID=3075592 RepID=A0ABU3DPN5_9FLAO|nr:hypothetical protein [Zunongwangia sp. F225]MDT0685573.1 hypothetical protein [Zunongwangia sp. F225]